MDEFFAAWARAFDGMCRLIADSLKELFRLS
jgi:hypothetical protein